MFFVNCHFYNNWSGFSPNLHLKANTPRESSRRFFGNGLALEVASAHYKNGKWEAIRDKSSEATKLLMRRSPKARQSHSGSVQAAPLQ